MTRNYQAGASWKSDFCNDANVPTCFQTCEPDSEFFGKLADGEQISSSLLAYTEFWAALLAKERAGAITPRQRQLAWQSFSNKVREESILLLPLSLAIHTKANWILESCHPGVPLRSLDALHLASCDHVQDWPLCTTDMRMREAAAVLRFPLLPENS